MNFNFFGVLFYTMSKVFINNCNLELKILFNLSTLKIRLGVAFFLTNANSND